MDHYIDITLLPDPDFKAAMLMGVLFNKLHRGLVERQSNRIAVSFPQYGGKGKSARLGAVLRLHGDEQSLQGLMDINWLKGMRDHIDQSAILSVPTAHKLVVVKRVQCKSSVLRLRERRMKRHNETMEQAIAAIPDEVGKKLEFPFVTIKSSSTGQQFKLFVNQQFTTEPNLDATYNCYGLSTTGAVPYF